MSTTTLPPSVAYRLRMMARLLRLDAARLSNPETATLRGYADELESILVDTAEVPAIRQPASDPDPTDPTECRRCGRNPYRQDSAGCLCGA